MGDGITDNDPVIMDMERQIQALEAENERLRAKLEAADALAQSIRDARSVSILIPAIIEKHLRAYEQISAAPSTTHSGQSGGGVPCAPTSSSGGDDRCSDQGAAPSTADVPMTTEPVPCPRCGGLGVFQRNEPGGLHDPEPCDECEPQPQKGGDADAGQPTAAARPEGLNVATTPRSPNAEGGASSPPSYKDVARVARALFVAGLGDYFVSPHDAWMREVNRHMWMRAARYVLRLVDAERRACANEVLGWNGETDRNRILDRIGTLPEGVE